MCENVQPKRLWIAVFGGDVADDLAHVVASTEGIATNVLMRQQGKGEVFRRVVEHGALVMHDAGPAVCCYEGCTTPPSFIDATGNLYCCTHATNVQDGIDAQLGEPPSMTGLWCSNDPCESPATYRYWNGSKWVYLCTPCKQAFEWGQVNRDAAVEESGANIRDDEEWRADKREEMGLDNKYPWLLEEDDGSLDESTQEKVCDVPA